MKKVFNGVLILEGSNDASYVSSLVDVITVITNGYEIPKEELDFLINLPKEKQIYILTDSDKAGKQIRNRLNTLLPGAVDIYVDINKCNKNNKHGVAECEKEELLNTLSKYLVDEQNKGELTTKDLYLIGLDDKNKRDYVAKQMHLGKCNNKVFLKRINYLNIDIKQIQKSLENYGNK